MLSQVAAVRRLPLFIRQSVRFFATPVETPKAPDVGAKTSGTGSIGSDSILKSATHKPDNMEKRMLVWTGKYKSVDEVPAFVK